MPKRPADEVKLEGALDLFISELPSDDMEKVLAENRYAGEQVKKDRIPRRYFKKYGVNNLYRYHHPQGYRSTYTVLTLTKGVFLVVILDLLNHEEYDDLFGY